MEEENINSITVYPRSDEHEMSVSLKLLADGWILETGKRHEGYWAEYAYIDEEAWYSKLCLRMKDRTVYKRSFFNSKWKFSHKHERKEKTYAIDSDRIDEELLAVLDSINEFEHPSQTHLEETISG